MTASTPVPTAPEQQTPPDLDALEGQVNDHLAELNEERGRLSLDAIGGDEAALAELTDCETQIAEAVEALARIDAARVELTRRAIAEENDRRSKEHREAIVQAKALQSERYDAAVALDKAAQVFAAAAASYRQAAIQQVSRLAAAGIREDIRSGASPRLTVLSGRFCMPCASTAPATC